MDDVFRAVVLMIGGAVFGFALVQGRLYYERWRRTGIGRYGWIMVMRLALAGLLAMVGVELIQRLGDEFTYRAPGALVVYSLTIAALWGILRDDEKREDDEIRTRGGDRREQG